MRPCDPYFDPYCDNAPNRDASWANGYQDREFNSQDRNPYYMEPNDNDEWRDTYDYWTYQTYIDDFWARGSTNYTPNQSRGRVTMREPYWAEMRTVPAPEP
jgi:hypothetical protein